MNQIIPGAQIGAFKQSASLSVKPRKRTETVKSVNSW